MRHVPVQQKRIPRVALYSLVFDAVLVRYVVAMLFIFFLMHPVMPALAAEDNPETPAESVSEEVVPEPVVETESDEPEVIIEEVPEEQIVEESGADTVLIEDEPLEDSGDTQTTEVIDYETLEDASVESETSVIDDVAPEDDSILDAVIDDLPDVSVEPETIDVAEDEQPLDATESEDDELDTIIQTPSDEFSSTSTSETVDEPTATNQEDVEVTDLETLSQQLASSTQADDVDNDNSNLADENVVTPGSGGGDGSSQGTTTVDAQINETDQINQEDSNNAPVDEDNGSAEDDTDAENDALTSDVSTVIEHSTTTSSSSAVIDDNVYLVSPVNVVTNNLNAHQFSNTECVSVGDGSYYCSENETAPKYVEDRVFSAPDSDGDMEIFVTIESRTTQITHNIVDDAAPQYDGLSNTIVWHSMQNDRFQIAQYDVKSGEVTYLTDTSYNNMEPVAYGDIVMWQAWIGSNWEIMILDNGELTQLTDNDVHDITPQLRDGYVMWQTQFAEGWKVALYDEKADKVNYIADSDGSKVANPRFVLVYDSTDKVGDVRTLGYDFGSGSSFTLGSLPAELPDEIPEPDQTGETRALIQAKPSTREGEVDEIQPVPTDSSGTTTIKSATSTTANVVPSVDNGTEDLIIEPIVSVATSTETVFEEVQAPEEIVDMLVEEALSTNEENVSHIEDVVIPPYFDTTTDEVS